MLSQAALLQTLWSSTSESAASWSNQMGAADPNRPACSGGGPQRGPGQALENELRAILNSPAQAGTPGGPESALDSRAVAALLKRLSSRDNGDAAVQLFNWLRSFPSDHKFHALCDVYTYTAMISTCVKDKNIERAVELYEDMGAKGIVRNVHTFSAMMNVCIKSGQLKMALKVYEDMREVGCVPNRVTYHTLVDAYGKAGLWKQALCVKEEMESQGLKPDVRTYNTLMIACNSSGQWQEALMLYDELVMKGLQPNTVTFNALITAYSKAGRLNKVLEVYQTMLVNGCERSVITLSLVISACEKSGQWQLALQLFSDMEAEGCTPNVVTYNSVLRACAQGGQWKVAKGLLGTMRQRGCTPDMSTYTSLTMTYLSAGKWQLALQTLSQMQESRHTPDSNLYCTVIDDCWNSGLHCVQSAAVELCKVARCQGSLGAGMSPANVSCLDVFLPLLQPGLAMATLCCWLQELRQILGGETSPSVPEEIFIKVGKGKWATQNQAGSQPCVREAVMSFMAAIESPFVAASWSGLTNCLSASTADVAKWLQSCPKVAQWLGAFHMPHAATTLTLSSAAIEAEDAMEEQSASAYAAVTHFEMTHCLNVPAMPRLYIKLRSHIIKQLLVVLNPLNLPPAVVADGVLLLDRFMSAGSTSQEDQETLLVAALVCVVMVLRNANSGQVNHVMETGAGLLGQPLPALVNMELRIRNVLQNDTSAISARRCVNLFLTRLGLTQSWIASLPVFEQMVCRDVTRLMQRVMMDIDFLNFPPSLIASSVMSFYRMQLGILPYWPTALVRLTNGSLASNPKLITGIMPVLRRFSAELQSSGEFLLSSSSSIDPDLTTRSLSNLSTLSSFSNLSLE